MPMNNLYALKTRQRLLVAAIATCFASAPAWSNPSGPQVVNGSASFSQNGNRLTVTNSSGAIINWNSFSIGANETTRFNQASTSSSVLNRVLASDPSVLLGTLSSNGRVWLVNPAGIMVGQGARIDVAGFVASTLNVRNEDFLAGRLNFQATPNAGKLENSGQITTPSGGSVYLIAPAVSNNGIINAPNGEVLLAAGQKVDLIDTGTPGVKVEISGAESSATNLGQIVAEAGRIGMAGVLVKNSGLLNASSVVREGGRVFLKASQEATAGGGISANSETGPGGRIEVAGAAVSVPAGAVLDASGDTKGGTILVGGGYQGKDASIANASSTSIESSASLKANATGSGDGGLIVAWSDDRTSAYGNFSARGGENGGRGGLVETSGKRSLDVAGARVDTRAADGSAGTWLLDPADITIVNASATGSPVYAPTGASSTIADDDINATLATTNVAITTSSGTGGSGNITVNGYADSGSNAYIYTSGSGARTLTLNADGKIDIHGGASISGTSGAPLTLNLYAGGDITHAGSIYTYGSAYFLSKGAITFGDTGGYSGYLSSSYGSPVTLIANWDGSSTAPNISDGGQCAGSAFCGISGSGSIASNYGISGSGSLVDAGAVTLKAPGNIDLSSITINASGGNYSSSIAAGIGGAGGAVSIASTKGNLTTGYIYASGSQGGYGAGATSSAVNGGTGGTGGPGGTVSLSAAGTLTLDGGIYVSGGYGGSGGAGYYDYSLVPAAYAGAGGAGGAGGNAGMISMSGASLTLSGATLEASGGSGGSAGSGTTAGSAGAGGSASPVLLSTAGDIVLTGSNYVTANQVDLFAGKSIAFGTTGTSPTSGYLYSYSSPVTLLANWNGSTTAPDIAASGQCAGSTFCGISGSGSIDSSYYYYSSLANAGAVTLKAPGDIDLSSISIDADGRYGSASGSAGGAGGTVSIASTKGNLTTGSISASGGGGSSGTYGSSSEVNGGTGGAGGVGGTVNLSAAGTLTVDGNINVEGGYGGSGGSGYYFWDSGTSRYVYSGTGGNGGAGGNAGTINASGASLILSGATLNANGGEGGSGGYYGTATGSVGAKGSASPITLSTAGDIALIGGNNVNASQVNLFAGKSISFGTTGASPSSGYLYSYSAPITLIANWNGSTTAPDIASSGQCTDFTFCGISGSGSIDSSYYYYSSLTNAGAVTVKAPGDIDLSNISINAYGRYGSGYGSAGGNGGAVSIASTKGNLTTGSISASGGGGSSGSYGSSSSVDGGTGGAGGAGGTVSLSAAGTLTGEGSINVNGGYGGYGGSGYYVWDSGTSSYVYSGTGGNGGAGGNAGTINMSGASLIQSGAALNANGGSGESGGQGTTAGASAGGGSGGNVTLIAFAGDLTTGHINAGGGGGSYGNDGSSGSVNGGTGGAGGVGGTIGLSAAGTLTLGGTTNVAGGYGGSGGSGYYVWDSGTSSYVYSGTGGNGGAGGNAGTMSANGAALILSAATLNANGGAGGSGGYSGTTTGSTGANGNANPVTLATAGDITVAGSNYVNASQFNMLSGKSIVFGTTGSSPTSGYLTSYGTPITLLANWNGSTAAPDIAAGGQCTDSSFCGISGTGSIDSNYYYYYESYNSFVDPGAVTVKAPGDIDLSNISIYTRGRYGYSSGSAGGSGGAVTITSTKGNLTVGYVDAGGGGGGSGSYGNSSVLNGGTGGAGGAGGAISLSAAGTLTVDGTINDNGGYGGYGGSGYQTYDTNTSVYVYSGTGGDGGAGGNAGAITMSGASLVLSGATVNANGGSGGQSGQGTAPGLAGGGGTGGSVILAATTGDLSTGYSINASGGSGASGIGGSSSVVNGGAGGTGGAGGAVSLSAAGTLTLGGTTRVAGGSGGYGGSGYYAYDTNTSSYVYSGTGGDGGAGGNAGTVALSGASITLDNAHLDALGGFGGISGYDGAATRVRGAAGASNALQIATPGDIRVFGSNTLVASRAMLLAGKSISLGSPGDAVTSASNGYLNSNTSETVLMANWNSSTGTPDVAATAQCGTVFCGISGSGDITNGYGYYDGYYEGYYYGGQLQDLHAGAITLKAAGPVDLKSISVSSIGGDGGNYYDYYYTGTKEAGNGGAITISSTQGDVTLGNVSAVGGYGRYGINGTATDPNGGAAGAGGAGGSIHASAAGSLIANEYIDASGGGGGQGGYGYYDSSLATYTGAGGAGGAGGNGGSITLNGASITLDNVNIRVLGGYPGSGNSSGTTTGAQGTFGAANNLQLGTTGNITVLGYNNLAASKVALLAGQAITLGSSASATSGDINSIAGDTLVVANWNGSTGAPDVAATAQCGGAFCGISGTGSISNGYDYYGGYYYTGQLLNQNGGAITLKAAGPIDLTSISVHSIGGDGGNYYYLGMQEAGNGGAVTVSSTQSDVTLGNVSVAGGYGRYGTSGSATSPNGGTGGPGGAGGSVHASAAGSLTLTGSIDVSGGHGYWGGDGYYDSSLAAYTGTGGVGGGGGNAGTINVSSASMNLSGASLYASGGSGGSGATGGTTAGSIGASGSASPITLATAGDITLSGSNYADSAQVSLVAGKNIAFSSGADLSTSATGDALVLAAAGNFINNAGASALDAPNGRWLVYSTNPTLDTKGGLDYQFKQYAMSYSGAAYSGAGVGNGFIYSVAPIVTPSLTGATSKVYDGTTVASLTADNYAMVGMLDNDVIVMDTPTTGTYVDKNVGAGKSVSATVALLGASSGTANVYGYQLAGTTASGNIGQIGQKALSTWQGSTGGLWSNPANWDVLPDGANVLAVSIPAGGSYQVTYDLSAGNTSLQTLTSAQTLALSGGSLTVNSSLDTAGYAQSGGALSGSGNLTVRNSFSQTGGSIALTGSANATINQTAGDLIIHSLAAQKVSLAAQSGSIGQTGPIVASSLVTASVTGTALTDAGNQIGSFSANNSGSGNIELTSLGTLSVAGVADVPAIDNKGGNITLIADNVTATNAMVLATGDIIAQVAGDLKLNEGSSFAADRDISLTLKGAGSTLYLNEIAAAKPSYLWAKAPSTIHLDYTGRTTGGLVIEGAATDVLSYKSVADASGFFYGPTKLAASPGAGLDVAGVASPIMPEPIVTAIETVTNTITNSTIAATAAATTTTESAPKVEAPPPPAPVTASVGPGPLLLSNTTQTTGGTEGTFGGSPAATSAPASSGDSTAPSGQSDKPAADKPAEDKSIVAKKDDKKEDDKKEDKKKEEAPAKKEDKPAPKKLATCS